MANIKKEKKEVKTPVSVSLSERQVLFLIEIDKKYGGVGSVTGGIEKIMLLNGFPKNPEKNSQTKQ